MNARTAGAVALGDFTATLYIAWLLLRLIGFFTNAFYFHRFGTALVSPAGNHLGWYAMLVPVSGGLIVGLMARYGSERIRSHGIPEARAVRREGSHHHDRRRDRIGRRAAFSSHRGGAQTLLVAGAAAGMSATFATPVAARRDILGLALCFRSLNTRSSSALRDSPDAPSPDCWPAAFRRF